jgi:hypothetical protein
MASKEKGKRQYDKQVEAKNRNLIRSRPTFLKIFMLDRTNVAEKT